MARQLHKIKIALATTREKELALSSQLRQLEQMLNQEKQRLSLLQQYQHQLQQQSDQRPTSHATLHSLLPSTDYFHDTLLKNIKRQMVKINELQDAYNAQHKLWKHYNQKVKTLLRMLEHQQKATTES